MSRQKFAGLILMMMISIIGIIWVQVIWIKNAISIRNENFNNAVIAGLNDAADIIESTRKMSFFNDFMFEDPLSLNNMSGDLAGYLRIGTYSSSDGGVLAIELQISLLHKQLTLRENCRALILCSIGMTPLFIPTPEPT